MQLWWFPTDSRFTRDRGGVPVAGNGRQSSGTPTGGYA